MEIPWPRNMSFNDTPHPLDFRLAIIAAVGLAVVQVVCSCHCSECFIDFHTNRCYLYMYAADGLSGSASVRLLMQASLCSAEHQQLQCIYWCLCSTLKVLAHQRAHAGYHVFFGTLVDRCSHSSVCLTVLLVSVYIIVSPCILSITTTSRWPNYSLSGSPINSL